VALGAGVALLLADRLSREQRRAVGWSLLAVGALTTIPLAAKVVFGSPAEPSGRERFPDEPLAGIDPPRRWFEHVGVADEEAVSR
jgi:4-amino-4-deoxy-L-arabinose transferase-like glycosyltransferase